MLAGSTTFGKYEQPSESIEGRKNLRSRTRVSAPSLGSPFFLASNGDEIWCIVVPWSLKRGIHNNAHAHEARGSTIPENDGRSI